MRHPVRLFLFAIALIAVALYVLAQAALGDLDRIVESGGVQGAPTDPLPAIKSWALFLTAQVLPLRQPGAAMVAPGKTFRDCADCPEMVEIPAGYFLIGSPLTEHGRHQQFFGRYPVYHQFRFLNREGPRRLVHIARPFALSQTELTFAAWEAAQNDPDWEKVTGRPPRHIAFGEADYLTRPVTQVDQNDAHAYAKWLSYKTGQTYRLPSEAEWEYAARAGTVTRFPWGNAMEPGKAACFGCGGVWQGWRMGPVGRHPPNGFGLYDMIGNGWEWVADCFTPSHPAAIADGSAYRGGDCELVVFKGGNTFVPEWQNRSAMRVGPHNYNDDEGSTIRLLRELE